MDDTLVCNRKGTKDKIFTEMNNFHKDLKFTECEMINNQLTFLDLNLYFDENKTLQSKLYRKCDQVVLNNFRQAIMPKSQKISTLVGEIHRTNHCSSTKNELDSSLKELELIFLRNEYPKSLITKKYVKLDHEILNLKPINKKKQTKFVKTDIVALT